MVEALLVIAVFSAAIMAALSFIKTDSLNRLMLWMSSSALGADVDALCQLRGPLDKSTLVTTDGALLTVYRVVGTRRLVGRAEFNAQAEALSGVLGGLLVAGFNSRQHSTFAGFRSNPAGGANVIKGILTPSLTTARRFEADANFLFQDKLGAMGPFCVDTEVVFGVMTHPAGMSPAEQARWTEQRSKVVQKGPAADGAITQEIARVPPVLASRHSAALATLEDKLTNEGGGVGVMLDRLDAHEAVAVMRAFLNAETSEPGWRPRLLGDRHAGIKTMRSDSLDMALPPRIGRQVITERLREEFGDAECVRRGRLWYASIAVEVSSTPGMDGVPSFESLAESIGREIPFQFHMDLSPNGLEFNKLDHTLASFVGGAGDHNKALKRAVDELRAMRAAGDVVSALRMVFCTWGDSEQACVDRLSFLKSKVEGWGGMVASNEMGEPARLFASSAPGFAPGIPAPYIPGPLTEFSRMHPIFRQTSIWSSGQLVPFTKDGRAYPIHLGSPLQNFWGTLVFAPTGAGKSFMMNMLNAGIIFSPGAVELPMVTVVDKGPSAKGVVMLAKAILPKELAAQVVYWRPTPRDAEYTVNPFDTQLGCDRPLDSERDYIAALLGGIANNLGAEGGKLIGRLIDVAYERFGRVSPQAKKWQWAAAPHLSERLVSVGIEYNEDKPPRIWDVVDKFFAAGMIREASEAQFHAVPQMGDLTSVLQDRQIQDIYGNAPAPNGERMVAVLERNLISAASEYALFFGVTRHHSSARFVVIDVEGMAGASQSEEGARRFALTLLFARRLGARNYFLHKDDILAVCPPQFQDYQINRVQRIMESPKFLMYDEIHNAKGIASVQNLLQKDAREGRKYNVVGILSSQDLDDFPADLVKNCYNFFILGAGNAESGRVLQRTFDLTDTETQAVMTQCVKPGAFFGMFRTNRGLLSQLLFTRPGPREIWAYNTSATDMALRDALYERLGVRNALLFLAKEFPGGSARLWIDDMRRQMSLDASTSGGITEMAIKTLESKISAFVSAVSVAA